MIPSDLFAPGERSVISIKDLNKDQVHEITTVFNPISTHTKLVNITTQLSGSVDH